ncbi:hypothetical protein FGO68_gene10812 [Halteria grandinella]|uniref:Uncharacterized protein n=1 Tax=Halteria grandinella TaxID=5974 RepID=A0A8J8NSQ3_HALGN|nr:hypothetical protein FGO68_gene10812 [Halteria grandinella]
MHIISNSQRSPSPSLASVLCRLKRLKPHLRQIPLTMVPSMGISPMTRLAGTYFQDSVMYSQTCSWCTSCKRGTHWPHLAQQLLYGDNRWTAGGVYLWTGHRTLCDPGLPAIRRPRQAPTLLGPRLAGGFPQRQVKTQPTIIPPTTTTNQTTVSQNYKVNMAYLYRNSHHSGNSEARVLIQTMERDFLTQ